MFGTLFTTRLSENLTSVFADAGATPEQAAEATATIDPQVLDQLPATVRDGIVTAYADALAPVFWYVLPFIGVAFVLSLFLKQVPLSDVGGDEAERLEAEQRASADARTSRAARAADPGDASNAPERDRRER